VFSGWQGEQALADRVKGAGSNIAKDDAQRAETERGFGGGSERSGRGSTHEENREC
jgi:hypothetical protein